LVQSNPNLLSLIQTNPQTLLSLLQTTVQQTQMQTQQTQIPQQIITNQFGSNPSLVFPLSSTTTSPTPTASISNLSSLSSQQTDLLKSYLSHHQPVCLCFSLFYFVIVFVLYVVIVFVVFISIIFVCVCFTHFIYLFIGFFITLSFILCYLF
jgi:hypothetical protein